MFKKIFLLSCAVLGIAGLPHYAQDISSVLEVREEPAAPEAKVMAATQTAGQSQAHYTSGVRAASIGLDDGGHFSENFRVNGHHIRGLIDTGATYVALNVSTARSLGLGLTNSDFRYEVSTANGKTSAALVVLERMEVGSITVRDVEAFVLADEALTKTLIGMSFMSKLKSYHVKGNRLELIN
ncbi:TIGR02281 family clan AA aspartic protease [Hoeflea sp.]|uniref:TIGR02281 family clan AA aspartic protease n=1 Tax=Hoeflea sp. TaxID=1940281 RepID=UPI003B52CE70